ncbi:hypothetical protein [Rhabdothermincola salaria]|uniref:hypothetical protein n=1 Tax=Rhabdothermincola salaria TaxID=2903142 RepID=UPI001E5C587E|nr:hypothetical protein [Rhabdothermincola salaria]MCD9625261.1 hypothetical protein [Rhabdothermincola salaria]
MSVVQMSQRSDRQSRLSKVGMMSSRFTESRLLLLAGAVVAVMIAALAFVSDDVAVRAIGWFLAGPVATTLVAMNRSATTRWSAQTGRVPPQWQTVASVALVAVGFAISILHASFVAWELS